jgi:hypothetical protein
VKFTESDREMERERENDNKRKEERMKDLERSKQGSVGWKI